MAEVRRPIPSQEYERTHKGIDRGCKTDDETQNLQAERVRREVVRG